MADILIQDRQVARERAKRRLVAARIRSNYKYKDPSKIPAKASEETEQKVKEHAITLASRQSPFASAK